MTGSDIPVDCSAGSSPFAFVIVATMSSVVEATLVLALMLVLVLILLVALMAGRTV
jgi:hypothetical protein